MRMVVAVCLAAFAGLTLAAEAAPVDTRGRTVATVATGTSSVEPVCRGCGCRGGAGYRLPNGKCAPRR